MRLYPSSLGSDGSRVNLRAVGEEVIRPHGPRSNQTSFRWGNFRSPASAYVLHGTTCPLRQLNPSCMHITLLTGNSLPFPWYSLQLDQILSRKCPKLHLLRPSSTRGRAFCLLQWVLPRPHRHPLFPPVLHCVVPLNPQRPWVLGPCCGARDTRCRSQRTQRGCYSAVSRGPRSSMNDNVP